MPDTWNCFLLDSNPWPFWVESELPTCCSTPNSSSVFNLGLNLSAVKTRIWNPKKKKKKKTWHAVRPNVGIFGTRVFTLVNAVPIVSRTFQFVKCQVWRLPFRSHHQQVGNTLVTLLRHFMLTYIQYTDLPPQVFVSGCRGSARFGFIFEHFKNSTNSKKRKKQEKRSHMKY